MIKSFENQKSGQLSSTNSRKSDAVPSIINPKVSSTQKVFEMTSSQHEIINEEKAEEEDKKSKEEIRRSFNVIKIIPSEKSFRDVERPSAINILDVKKKFGIDTVFEEKKGGE